jgi:hypothetical protein
MEFWGKLLDEINNFLNSHEYKPAMKCLTQDVEYAIFGKYWRSSGISTENLQSLQQRARTVKKTMFFDASHLFCVTVICSGTSLIPTRPENDNHCFNYEVSCRDTVQISIKTLFRGATPPLYLFSQESGKSEQKRNVQSKQSNEVTLIFDQPVTLTRDFFINSDANNDQFILKSENGDVILRMNFNGKDWRPNADPYASERALFQQLEDMLLKQAARAPDPEDVQGYVHHLRENFDMILESLPKPAVTPAAKKRRLTAMLELLERLQAS